MAHGQTWPGFDLRRGEFRPSLSRSQRKLAPNSAIVCRLRPNLGRSRPMLQRFRPSKEKVSATFDRCRPHVARIRPELGRALQITAEIGPTLAEESAQTRSTFTPTKVKSGTTLPRAISPECRHSDICTTHATHAVHTRHGCTLHMLQRARFTEHTPSSHMCRRPTP